MNQASRKARGDLVRNDPNTPTPVVITKAAQHRARLRCAEYGIDLADRLDLLDKLGLLDGWHPSFGGGTSDGADARLIADRYPDRGTSGDPTKEES